MKLISLVIPAYQEEKTLPDMVLSTEKVLQSLSYDYEIIVINDGSTDHTWDIIKKLCQSNSRIRGLNMSRNFGKEIALTAGLEYACGDAVITIDGDGQHPAIKIPDFIEQREK